VGSLLTACAEWHALAKLRLHTEETLDLFQAVTIRLVDRFRAFVIVTWAAYDTRETAAEARARLKREAVHASSNDDTVTSNPEGGNLNPDPPGTADPPGIADPGRASLSAVNPTVAPLRPNLANEQLEPHIPHTGVAPNPPVPTPPTGPDLASDNPDSEGPQKGRIKKHFNLATYKYHALLDYPPTIRRYGTTDSYSTERVSS
jgi:hypothetical protein